MTDTQANIDYTRNKITELQSSIDFYIRVGARKDLSGLLADMADLQQIHNNYQHVLTNGPQTNTGLKVLVTTHQGRLIIQTLNPEIFDTDFQPKGHGLIGCTLYNNVRLGISNEAFELMQTFKRVTDVIGDLMGEEDNFIWIGSSIIVKEPNSVVSRDFKLPKNYQIIDNTTSVEILQLVQEKKTTLIEYDDFKQELWIEISKKGLWKKTPVPKDHVYMLDNFYTLNCPNGGRFVGGTIYDKSMKILNAPVDMLIHKERCKIVKISKDMQTAILNTCLTIFQKAIPSADIMAYINPLFDLGFDHNVMHPYEGFWRMSIKATPKVMLEKLKAFKKEVI